MTQSNTASAKTQHASKYLQQLCKHWSHKAEATFSPDAGHLVFPSGTTLTLSAHSDHLEMTTTVPADADLVQWQDVVDRHLERFAFREELEIIWQ